MKNNKIQQNINNNDSHFSNEEFIQQICNLKNNNNNTLNEFEKLINDNSNKNVKLYQMILVILKMILLIIKTFL